MRYSSLKILFLVAIICVGSAPVLSQSRDQNFPTPVTSNEIDGVIKARDIGDSRLTTYFYTFEGTQGDIFLNIVTKNLTGDIDVFTADSLQPLSKVVLYADSTQNETGRLVYLRRPARLILRVQGRSPNDDPATFRIKFAGSFVAMAAKEADDGPLLERSDRSENSGIRVNSVGTIIEILSKPAKEEIKAGEPEKVEETDEATSGVAVKPPEEVAPPRTREAPEVKTVFGGRAGRSKEAASNTTKANAGEEKPASERDRKKSASSPPDPLAGIYLLILMKDGDQIRHPMTDVVRFSVDKGVLTVITKDRKTSRFSILDVDKVTIQ